MARLFWAELVKTFLKKRTYLGFLIALVVVPLIELAMASEGEFFIRRVMRNLANDFLILGNLFNGWTVAYQVMNALWIHVPLLITFVAGDMLSGEATAGTYRLMLIKPVSRTKILLAKALATLLYVVVFIAFLAALSVGLALALLGSGDLVVFQRGLLILAEADVAWRFMVAYLLALAPMFTIASIAFCFSSFVENAIGPIVATMGVIIVFTIITVMSLEAFEAVRPYLFTTHMVVWQKAFEDPVNWHAITASLLNLAFYTGAALLGAWAVFTRKDILS
ncbi:MAG: ABC transporter permease [Bacteroidetes bacterium]|jgi:ABC-2 type transport system permease protein|nr:ABC transporter permease [Bacteroidota bacterium]